MSGTLNGSNLVVSLAVGMVVVTACLPPTRHSAGRNLHELLSLGAENDSILTGFGLGKRNESRESTETYNLRLFAARHPDDYELQVGGALSLRRAEPKLARFGEVSERFPGHASVRAHILRYSCGSGSRWKVRLDRKEERMLSGLALPKEEPLPPEDVPSTFALQAYDQAAVEGERLDPDNAFFPFMRAVGLFAARRDSEALASIQLASRKPRWEDYSTEELHFVQRLRREALGERQTPLSTVMRPVVNIPHFAGLRAACRVAVYLAIQDEAIGRVREGVTIRQAVMRCGSLMRADSRQAIGTMVGIAMIGIAGKRPGGVRAKDNRSGLSEKQREEIRLNHYVDYLERHGFGAEARWVRAEFSADRDSMRIIKRGLSKSPMGRGAFTTLLICSLGGLFLLYNAVWLITLGVWGTIVRRSSGGRVVAAVVEVLSVALVTRMAGSLARWGMLLFMMHVLEETVRGGSAMAFPDHPGTVLAVSLLAALVFPATAWLVLGVIGRRSKAGFALTAARYGPPAAASLVCVYCVLNFAAVRTESCLTKSLSRAQQHEGRYYAILVGERWPGPVVVDKGQSK